jgi:predicted metal-dependent hydrolase
MELIANIMLAAGAFGLGAYCFVLQRKINRFSKLEDGMGGAIAVLSAQVDDMTRALSSARSAAAESSNRLEELTSRAEAAAVRLELLVSSLHDLPTAAAAPPADLGDRRTRFIRHRSRREQEVAE